MKLKRTFSIVLALLLLLSVCPISAFAAGEGCIDASSLKVAASNGVVTISGKTTATHNNPVLLAAAIVPTVVFNGTEDNGGIGGSANLGSWLTGKAEATTIGNVKTNLVSTTASDELNYYDAGNAFPNTYPTNAAGDTYMPASSVQTGQTAGTVAAGVQDFTITVGSAGDNIKAAAGYGITDYTVIVLDAIGIGSATTTTFQVDANGDSVKDPAKATVTDPSKTYDGSAVNPTITLAKGADGSGDAITTGITVEYKLKTAADTAYSTTAPTDAGTYVYRITHDDYNITDGTGEFTIAQAEVTLTATGVTKTYDGNTTITAGTLAVVGAKNGEDVKVSGLTYSSANVGDDIALAGTPVFKIGNAETKNYKLQDGFTVASLKGEITTATQATLNLTAPTPIKYGQTVTLSVSGGTGDGDVNYTITDGADKATVAGDKLTATKVGTIKVKATKAGGDNYDDVESIEATVVIDPAEPTVTFPEEIDVETLGEIDVTIKGVKDEEVTGTFTWVDGDDTPAVPGDYDWTFTSTDPNYGSTSGTLTIEAAEEPETHKVYIAGYADTTLFGPDDELNRGQAATILSRLWDGDADVFADDKNKTVQFTPKNLTDVAASQRDKWYYAAVGFAQAKGLINGFEDKTFQADRAITRGEFAAMLARFVYGGDANVPADGTCTKFKDAKDSGYEKYIAVLEAFPEIKGYLDGSFRPGNTITRAEAVTMTNAVISRWQETAANAAQLQVTSPFTDVKAGQWFFNNVMEAAKEEHTSASDVYHK